LEQFLWSNFGSVECSETRQGDLYQTDVNPLAWGNILNWRFSLPQLIALSTTRWCRHPWRIVTMQHVHTLLAELEFSLAERPSSQRFTILRKLTDLFLAGADSFSDDSMQVFDELMDRLIVQIERQALIELSNRLAPAGRYRSGWHKPSLLIQLASFLLHQRRNLMVSTEQAIAALHISRNGPKRSRLCVCCWRSICRAAL
jgi:hypothetical protein